MALTMNNMNMKKKLVALVIAVLLIAAMVSITAHAAAPAAEVVVTSKKDEVGTAGSNIPLKDNLTEAKIQIEAGVADIFEEAFGDKIDDVKVTIDKIYNTEDEQAFEPVKKMNLGMNEVAFEATIELHPTEGTDVNELMIPNGEFDEASGWVKNVQRLGVLRENQDSSDPAYIITDFGTGW